MNRKPLQESFRKHYVILFYLLFAVLIIAAISQKMYFYVDDYGGYSISNTQEGRGLNFTNVVFPRKLVFDNQTYTPASEFYTKLTCVKKGEQFDYKGVILNSTEEPHPPLHYILLHTICSFFPGVFSKWFAGAINIFFSLWLLFVARKLMEILTKDESIVNAVSLTIVCSSALLNANAFLRMYIMAMFCVTFETYAVCCLMSNKLHMKSFLLIFIATLLGGLTHYYCSLYSVIISTLFAMYLIKNKEWKTLIIFSLTQIFSALTVCLMFPAILHNVLKFMVGGTAPVVVHLSAEVASYPELLLYYIQLMNQQWFGGILPILLPAMFFFAVRNATSNTIATNEEHITTLRRCCLIFISTIVYCILVSARNLRIKWNYISMDFRYLHPVWITTLCACFAYFLTNMKEYMWRRQEFVKYAKLLQIVIVTAVILGTFHYTDWNGRNLYRAYNTYEYIRKPYYNADCIVLTGDTISSYTAFEMSCYKSLTWIKLVKTTPERLQQLATGNKLVICVEAFDAQADEIMMQVMKILPEFKISVKLPMFANLPDFERPGNIYYLDRRVRKSL